MRYLLFAILICATVLSSWTTVFADAEGNALARQVYERPDGRDFISVGEMRLRSPDSLMRIRRMITYRLDKGGGEVRSLLRFSEPADMQGVGILTHDLKGVNKEQLVYLPDIKRARRIASARKGGHFVGSDIYFEDLRDRPPKLDEHRIIAEEKLSHCVCLVLESVPIVAKNSVYRKRVSWIDPSNLLTMRIDYYQEHESEPVKRLQVHEIELLQGYWTVMRATISDLKSEHHTEIIIDTIDYDQQLPHQIFSRRALEDAQFIQNLLPSS